MNREHVVLVFLILFITIHTLAATPSARSVPNSSSESPGVEWNKTYGGGSATSIQQASDGGYVFADGWLVDTDSSGNMRWNKTYDGSARSVEQTADGGYIIGGSIPQKDYDYLSDGWLGKTDPSGNLEWDKTYGGDRNEQINSVQETGDGGYIFTGTKNEFIPMDQVWLVKTDANGSQQWEKTFGGDGWNDFGNSVQETNDGGYIVTGTTEYSIDMSWDFWLIKTNASGDTEWARTFGGSGWDGAFSVRQTNDDGYIVVGTTYSFGIGNSDFWLVKTDDVGNMQWNRTYGGLGFEYASAVQQTSDGGYILAGSTSPSTDYDSADFLLIRTDDLGNTLWNATYGGSLRDEAYDVQVSKDGGYIVAGRTESFGVQNAWIIKLAPDVVPEFSSFLVLPLFMIATLLAAIVHRKKRISTR